MTKRLFALAGAVVLISACSTTNGGSTASTGQPSATQGSPSGDAAAPGAALASQPGATGASQRGTAAGAGPASSAAGASRPAEARAADAQPEAPPARKFKEVTIPSGTTLNVKLQTAVASDTSKAEDKVRATLNKPLVVDGTTAVPAGAEVTGSVLEAHESGRVKGRASIALRFERLHAWKEIYDIHTARISREAAATKGDDAKKIGIGAGAGAAVGAIAGGKKGAGIGALVGGGAGTGVVMATKGEEVRLPPGTVVTTTLAEAVKVTVPLQ